jgi:hypothetical protein
MIQVPASTPAKSGKNAGNVTVYAWPTAIKPEDNATGLPTKDGKVMVNVSGDTFQVSQFETHAEIVSAAGSQEAYERVTLELYNAKLSSAQLQTARQAFGKLTAAPLDVLAYVRERVAAFDVTSLFSVKERAAKGSAGPRGVRAELANLATAAEEMSKEDLLAAILALSAKSK